MGTKKWDPKQLRKARKERVLPRSGAGPHEPKKRRILEEIYEEESAEEITRVLRGDDAPPNYGTDPNDIDEFEDLTGLGKDLEDLDEEDSLEEDDDE